jgi:rod shape-determining protein MreC
VSYFNSANQVSGKILNKWQNVKEYFNLRNINDSLLLENQNLRNNLEKYRNEKLPSINKSGFEYIAAKVINISVNKSNNFICVDKGTNHGIKQEMAVISSNGVVGLVVSVSENFSTIMPIINKESALSVKLEKNNYFGSLTWNANSPTEAILSEIPAYVSLNKGDKIVTTGFSLIFPEGLPVGVIKNFKTNESDKFYTITISLFTDFHNLNHVYIIKNDFVNELKTLKTKTE